MTTSNIKLFAIALSFISIMFSCSGDEMNGERTLRITDGSDLEADDSLILPYQTTGSFLTMDCRWLQEKATQQMLWVVVLKIKMEKSWVVKTLT